MRCGHSIRPGGFHKSLCLLLVLLVFVASTLLRAGAQQIRLPPVTRVQWDNGARLILMEYRKAPTLNVLVLFPGGGSADPAGKAGVASLTATLLRQGTEKRTAPQIAEEIDLLGGSLNAEADEDKIALSLDVLAKDTDAGLDLLADVIRHPTFPAEELERARQLALAELQALPEDLSAVADRVAQETIYAGHPYGTAETTTSLKAIARDDLLDCYRRFLAPNRMIVVAVGNFKTGEMLAKLRARFGDWQPHRGTGDSEHLPPRTSERRVPPPRRIVLVDVTDATQTQVRLGRVALPRAHPDYLAARIAGTMLGGGFTSRLTEEIRVNRALTYGISAGFDGLLRSGDFTVSTFTKVETTRVLLDAVNALLRRTAEKGFAAAELKRVKGYLAGLFAINVQTPEALAGQLASIAFYGLPDDYLRTYLNRLRAVTLQQVNRIARTYFDPASLSMILVAPASKVTSRLKGSGPVETRPVGTVGR